MAEIGMNGAHVAPKGDDRTLPAALVSIALGLLAVLASPFIGIAMLSLLESAGLRLERFGTMYLAAFLSGGVVGLTVQAVLLAGFRHVRPVALCLANFAAALLVYAIAAVVSGHGIDRGGYLGDTAGLVVMFSPLAFAAYAPAFVALGLLRRRRRR